MPILKIARYAAILLLLALTLIPARAQSSKAKVTAIVGIVEIKTPGATEFQALKLNQEVPVGSVISTMDNGEVILQGVGGSLFKIEPKSQVWIDQLTAVPATADKPAPVSQSQYSIDRGDTSYIFDQFPDEKSGQTESYFKIKTPAGIAAARGGSGYMSSDGECGALSGTLDVHTLSGQQIVIPAGSGGKLSLKDGLGPLHILNDDPFYSHRIASVLSLANNGVSRGLINPRERILAAICAHHAGFTPDQVNEMMSHPPRAQWNREPDMNRNWNKQDWNKQDWNKQDWNKQDWNKQDWNRQDWQQNSPQNPAPNNRPRRNRP